MSLKGTGYLGDRAGQQTTTSCLLKRLAYSLLPQPCYLLRHPPPHKKIILKLESQGGFPRDHCVIGTPARVSSPVSRETMSELGIEAFIKKEKALHSGGWVG